MSRPANPGTARPVLKWAVAIVALPLAIYFAIVATTFLQMSPTQILHSRLFHNQRAFGPVVPIPEALEELHWRVRGRGLVIAMADDPGLRDFVFRFVRSEGMDCPVTARDRAKEAEWGIRPRLTPWKSSRIDEVRVVELLADIHMPDPRGVEPNPCPSWESTYPNGGRPDDARIPGVEDVSR